MVPTKTNRQAIEDLYASFEDHDRGPAYACFTDDTVWEEPAGNERSGVFRGVVEIALHAIHCRKLTDSTFGSEVLEILVGMRYVVVVERALGLRNGMALNMLVNTVFEMTDGVIHKVRVLPFDCQKWNEFWS
jgi:ketosteroid isomerase-like protein